MPRPQPERKAYKPVIEHPENTRYDGFLDDLNRLLELCNDSGLYEKINAVIGELEAKINSLNGEEQRPQRESLEKVKDQIVGYGQFIHDFKERYNGDTNSLFYMTNSDRYRGRVWGEEGFLTISFEGGYGEYMHDFEEMVWRGRDLFRQNGEVRNIKADADAYNLATGYRDYADTNSLMYKIDDIFNGVTRFFTELERMDALNDKYKKETELEQNLNVEKTNLEQYGKLLVDQPGFSITTWKTQKRDAFIESNRAKDELDAASVEKNRADEDLRKVQKELSDIENQKLLSQESWERNKAEYARKKEALDNYLVCEPTLDKAFSAKFPSLDGFFEARDRKVDDYDTRAYGEEVGKLTDALQMDEWMLKQNMEKIGGKLGEVLKSSPDKRLKGFFDEETLRFQYTRYPGVARTLVRLISEIPYEMRGLISPETRAIGAVRADLQKLYEKNQNREKSKWEDNEKPVDARLLKKLLNIAEMAETLCPPEYRTFDLKEENLKKIEEQGSVMLAKSAGNEIFFLIDQLQEKEKELDLALAGEKEKEKLYTDLKDAKAARKKRKEKAAPDERQNIDNAKLEYENAVSRRKAKEEEINRIRENENYITGAKTVRNHIINHTNARKEYYDVNVKQAEMLLGLYKEEKRETDSRKNAMFSGWNRALNAMSGPLVSLKSLKGLPEGFYTEVKALETIYNEFGSLENEKNREMVQNKYTEFQNKLKELEGKYGKRYKTLAEDTVRHLAEQIVDQNFEEKIANKRKEVDAATKIVVEKGRVVEEKRAVYQNKRTAFNTIHNAFTTNNFYDRYIQGLNYDPNNLQRSEYKDAIKGKNFMRRIKTPIREALDRNAHAKKQDHQDSPQYEAMLIAMRTIVDGADDITAADHLENLRILKQAAEAYIRKKKKQWFHWKPSIQRKFRLQYAKSIIEICEQQMNTIDPADFSGTTDTAVKYFEREAVELPNEADREQNEEAYLAQLDGRKEEAIAAYFNSSSYKRSVVDAREAYKEQLEAIERKYLEVMNLQEASPEEKRRALDKLEASIEGFVPEEIDDSFNVDIAGKMIDDKQWNAFDEKIGLRKGELLLNQWHTNRTRKSLLELQREYENNTYNRVQKEAQAGYAPSIQELERLNTARADRQRKVEERRKKAEDQIENVEKIIIRQDEVINPQNEIIEIREDHRDDQIIDMKHKEKSLLEEKE